MYIDDDICSYFVPDYVRTAAFFSIEVEMTVADCLLT